MVLTKNFILDEFIDSNFYNKHQQEDVWDDYEFNAEELEPNVKELAKNLQVLRDEVKVPVYINIAYRPTWWEHQQGRSGRSQHTLCKAADIVVEGMTPKEVADKIEELIKAGDMKEGGLGRYNTFTHYDIRDYKARWNETN